MFHWNIWDGEETLWSCRWTNQGDITKCVYKGNNIYVNVLGNIYYHHHKSSKIFSDNKEHECFDIDKETISMAKLPTNLKHMNSCENVVSEVELTVQPLVMRYSVVIFWQVTSPKPFWAGIWTLMKMFAKID